MGCVSSVEGSSVKAFKVISVDSHCRPVCAGVMEIIGSDLVLNRKHKAPIKWPLLSVKKFGFVSTMFTFECGRRCPLGPGIYAFKCKQSYKLFRLLEKTFRTKNLIEETNSEVPLRNIEDKFKALAAAEEARHSDFYVLDIRKHQYVNLGLDTEESRKAITYAELELAESDEPRTPSPKPNKSYVVIDFEKTLALSQTTNSSIFEELGTRRTRHNSSLDE